MMPMQDFLRDETGYQRIQGTKPQTPGYALNDLPAGCAPDCREVSAPERLLMAISIVAHEG